MGKTMSGDYLYKEALGLVDYCGDIAKTKNGNEVVYNQDFSPNNIKRLVISPDAVLIFYHIATRHCPKFKVKMINPMMLQAIQYMEDYVPLTAVLYADRICASVEEVIILSSSNNGDVSLTTRELDFSSMLKTYKSGSTDIVDSIRNRYKRLYAYTVANTSFQKFMSWYQEIAQQDRIGYLLSKQEFFDDAKKQIFHEDDWYLGYGTSANYYDLDKEGSPLNKYFKTTIAKIESENKKSKVDESIKDEVEKSKGKFEKELNLYRGTLRCANRLKTMLLTQGYKFMKVHGLNTSFEVDRLTLAKTKFTKEGTKDYNVREETGSELSLISQNLNALKKWRMDLYSSIYTEFMQNLNILCREYSTMVKVMLQDFPKSGVHGVAGVQIPVLFEDLSVSFEDGSFLNSMSKICWQYCRLFVSPDGKSISEYVKDSSKWEEVAKV